MSRRRPIWPMMTFLPAMARTSFSRCANVSFFRPAYAQIHPPFHRIWNPAEENGMIAKGIQRCSSLYQIRHLFDIIDP
jgi:hypothetical protein